MSCILMGHFYVGRLPSLSCQPLEVDPMWYLAYTDYLLWEVTGEIPQHLVVAPGMMAYMFSFRT